MAKERCILAYSGGLDTSALVPYMQEKFGYDIICALVNVGRMKDLESLRQRGLTAGAIESSPTSRSRLSRPTPSTKASTRCTRRCPGRS
jgi:argininosuccinate synthase